MGGERKGASGAAFPTRKELRARLMDAIVTLLDEQSGVEGTWFAKPPEGATPEEAEEHVRRAKKVADEFADELAHRVEKLRSKSAKGARHGKR